MPGEAQHKGDWLRWRLPSFQRRVARARRVVQDALQCGRSYVGVSGGKDSLVVLALAAGAGLPVTALWSDDELEYPEQEAYIRDLCRRLAVPLTIVTGHATHNGWFTSWAGDPPWRPRPSGAFAIPGLADVWMREQGYTVTLLGLRAGENARRRQYLEAVGPRRETKAGLQINPLAGWQVDEVWAAIAGMGLPYNPVYDRLAEIGVPREQQRVGPLPLSPGWILKAGWPGMYRELVERYGPRW